MKQLVRITCLAMLVMSVVLTAAAADKTLKEVQKFTTGQLIGWNGNIHFADVNGDGYKDMVARYKRGTRHIAGVWLWKGAKFADSASCWIDLGFITEAKVAAGDLNGDGIADLAFLSQYSSQHAPKVVFGRATWPDSLKDPDLVCGTPEDTTFESQAQYSSLVIGDFNADGYGDICYQVQGNDTSGALMGLYGSQLNVFYGGAPMDSISDWMYKGGQTYTITGTNQTITPRYFSPWHMDVGDFNADGYLDILTSGWNAYSSINMYNNQGVMQSMYNCGAGLVFLGGTEFDDTAIPDVILMASDNWLKYTTPLQYLWLGYGVYNAGDLNGDRIDDISLPGWYLDIGLFFTGSDQWNAAGDDSEVLVVRNEYLSYTKNRFHFAAYADQMGMNTSSIGDVNGDGLGDLAVTRNFFGGYVNEERGIRLFYTKAGRTGAMTPDYETADYVQVLPGGFDVDGDGVSEFLAYDPDFHLTILKVNPLAINAVADNPFDQGGAVRLTFQTSMDNDLMKLPYFSLWRAIPADAIVRTGAGSVADVTPDFKGTAQFSSSVAGASFNWEWVKNVPAQMMGNYSASVPTLYDSGSAEGGKHYFMVIAHTSNPNVFLKSDIDSGYSVDNLAPAAPSPVAGTIVGSNARISWKANTESDLKQYVIYKAAVPDIPASAAPYATTMDTAFVDSAPLGTDPAYYVVRAEDIHGNLSGKSSEIRVTLVGVEITDTSVPAEYALQQNYPNPFNPTTTVEYALKEAGDVTINVINVLGEIVATLDSGHRVAGRYRVTFDASRLASGVYLYQIRAGKYVETKRMLLVK